MPDITLRVDLDLPLDPEDIARFDTYRASTGDESAAARQIAQDMLGSMGALVQEAEVIASSEDGS